MRDRWRHTCWRTVLVAMLVATLLAATGCGEVPPAAAGPAQGPALIGDLDGDGRPGVADAIAILRIVVGLQPSTATADATCDGAVSVADAIALLRCVVGLASWPITCDDRFELTDHREVPIFNDNPWNTDVPLLVHPGSRRT